MKRSIILAVFFATVLIAVPVLAQDFESQLQTCLSDVNGKNYPKAIQLCSQLIEARPGDYRAYFYRGVAYVYTGTISSFEKAEADLRRCTELKPKDADCHYYLGYSITVFDKNTPAKYDLAVKSYTQVVDLEPDRKDIYYRRGSAYLKGADSLEDFLYDGHNKPESKQKAKLYRELAVADFQKSLEVNPSLDHARFKLGLTQHMQGLYDQAVANLTSYIARQPDDKNAYHYRGAAYYNLKKYQLALNDIDKALEVNKTKYASESERKDFAERMTLTREYIAKDAGIASPASKKPASPAKRTIRSNKNS